MNIDVALAGKLFRVGPRQARRFLLRAGRPHTLPGKGHMHAWGMRHVVGVQTTCALIRQGVNLPEAERVGRMIGAFTSDEQFEATLSDRSWVLCCGGHALPELLSRETTVQVAKENADRLEGKNLQLVGVDVGPLFADVRRAVLALTQPAAQQEGECVPTE